MPTVIDDEDNTVSAAYDVFPDRLYVIGVDGRIAYKGKHGPHGFSPAEVDRWLKENTTP